MVHSVATSESEPYCVLATCLLHLPREYRAYWFFINLQLSVDRALLGARQGQQWPPCMRQPPPQHQLQQQQHEQQGKQEKQEVGALAGLLPAILDIKLKPFPWPSKAEDLGAASAAAFFNLLLVSTC